MESSQDEKIRRLKKFNQAMGVLHLVQGALILFLSTQSTMPVQQTLLGFDPGDGDGGTVTQTTNVLFDMPLAPLVAIFLLCSAVAHFAVSTGPGFEWYAGNLKKGINYARWYEYAISSSVMVVLIAMLCGIWELSALMLIFALNATMNLFGLMMELHNQTTQKTDWTAYVFGCFAGLVVWIVMGIYFFGAISSSTESVPWVVYLIFPILAAFFNIFAINMILQYRGKGKYADYLHGERVYVILSLTSKSALAWLVFSGTRWPG